MLQTAGAACSLHEGRPDAVEIRKAGMADVPVMHQLVNDFAQQGLMLRRPIMAIIEGIRDFSVAEVAGTVVGAGALHVLWHDLAEVRSLAVHADWHGRGVGKALVEALVSEADGLGLRRVFALTYQEAFFQRCGFSVIKKETLPQKVWKECVHCSKFHACDEIAMIRHLGPAQPAVEAESEAESVEIPLWVQE